MANVTMFLAIFTLSVWFLCVDSINFEDAQKSGKVKLHTLMRAKMDPIFISKLMDPERLDIFCYEGVSSVPLERIKRVFSTGRLHINMSGDDYRLFSGKNASYVWDSYAQSRKQWFVTWFPWQSQSVGVEPFNRTCVGVAAREDYSIVFNKHLIDPWLLLLFVCGIVLFFSADKLSRNILFYYGTGISIGVLASLLILVFVVSRFVPWKKGAYAFFLGGWAVVSWAFVQVWGNLRELLQNHLQYVLIYVGTVGLISFAVCYYKGPVRDPRSLNLIKWTIQLVAAIGVFLSMQVEEVAAAAILVMLSIHNFPRGVLRGWHRAFRRRFPSKRRLLTQEEYEQQANASTRKALDELREYCRSPDCDAWRTISRLGTPQRFAKWIEGESHHLSEDEIDMYESDPHPSLPEITDDEDEIDFRLNSL